LGTNVKKKE